MPWLSCVAAAAHPRPPLARALGRALPSQPCRQALSVVLTSSRSALVPELTGEEAPIAGEKAHVQHFDLLFSTFHVCGFKILNVKFQTFEFQLLDRLKKMLSTFY